MFNLMLKIGDDGTIKDIKEGQTFEQFYKTIPFETLEILLSARSTML